ncbi:MAG TPA: DUF4233 domain-containing protein [Mycobacteriales bacterium]|jgi:hypothetical protein|nr:DUF4233 domain-containing protein [Mycobacteriales bacterium]
MTDCPSEPGAGAGSAAPGPPRGLLGIGAGGLVLEALVLLLAAPAVAGAERGHVVAWHIVYLLVLGVLLIVAAARLRRPHGRMFASLLQPWVIVSGVITWPMYVVGVLFAGIWLYYIRLWRPTADQRDGTPVRLQ